MTMILDEPFLTGGIFTPLRHKFFPLLFDDDDDDLLIAALDVPSKRRRKPQQQQQQQHNNNTNNSEDGNGQQVATTNTAAVIIGRQPKFEVVSKDNEILIRGETPGIPKENIKVSVEGGRLSINGEAAERVDDEHFHMRKFGSFQQSWQLPDNLDADALTAKYEHGVLMVKIPKKQVEKPKARDITIE